MKKFHCTKCGNRIHFDNSSCLKCGAALGFDPFSLQPLALEPAATGGYRTIGRERKQVRYCENALHGVCNWLIPEHAGSTFCQACTLNRTIPNLAEPGQLDAWRELEKAKRRLTYALLRFGLPTDGGRTTIGPLTFDFVAGAQTGHLNGVITIDVGETNSVERERQRTYFAEGFRTLLGHLRHESGHYYWMLLVEAAGRLDEFRSLFGDERVDYGQALASYHGNGPRGDWDGWFVSRYASAHPWEDWAETWAHYLHIVATVDTAEALDMEPRPVLSRLNDIWRQDSRDVYRRGNFDSLMQRWLPLSVALNSLNRSMGHPDFYPYVIPTPAVAKLAFVHRLIRSGAG